MICDIKQVETKTDTIFMLNFDYTGYLQMFVIGPIWSFHPRPDRDLKKKYSWYRNMLIPIP